MAWTIVQSISSYSRPPRDPRDLLRATRRGQRHGAARELHQEPDRNEAENPELSLSLATVGEFMRARKKIPTFKDEASEREFWATADSTEYVDWSRGRRGGGKISVMETAKEQVHKILEMLPEDASLEDIQYHIYVRQRIQQGIDDVDAGRVVSHEEVERRLAEWCTK